MEAKIVKKIVIETRDVPDRTPYYREAVYDQAAAYVQTIKDGQYPDMQTTFHDITYERMNLVNPETKLVEHFYVNVNERKLWEQLVAVSDGFINSAIERGIQKFRDDFFNYDIPKIEERNWKRGVYDTGKRFMAIPWYKRLFYNAITHKYFDWTK
jgi:hypothetical protein